MPVVPVVLFAAALHAGWNALIKSVPGRVALMGTMGAATTGCALPLALFTAAPHQRAWVALGASAVLHGIYNLMLIATYRDGDYNQVYPIARGTAPPVVAVCSVLFVGERLSALQVTGLLILSGGLITLAFARRGAGSTRAVTLAVLTGLLIAAYTVTDGVGVRHAGTVLGYSGWLFTAEGLLTVLAVGALRARAVAEDPPADGATPTVWVRGAAAGALSVAAYMLVLWAQSRGALAVVAALRETSVVFAAVIGAFAFGEGLPSRRIAASLLVATGAAALALG